jgi:energy-coupling factor transporter ATP-binding protein EcfA2
MEHKKKTAVEMPLYPRGSEWRRWDLHVHTPASALENNFSGWDEYVAALEVKGAGVAVLGVTDYCSIEGYKRLLDYRAQGRLAGFQLLMPNLEFRTHPETSAGKAINIHILVSPHDDKHVEEIEHALQVLTYTYKDIPYPCIRASLIKLGKAHDQKQKDDEAAFRHGVNQFKPDFGAFRDWYLKQAWLKANSLVFISNGVDGASGLSKDAGFAAQREELYRFSQGVFSGKPKDREYFLGKGSDSAADVVRKCGSLKPCVHGSDAHGLEKLLEPDLQRYCWIKADPTFEGLRQILHEPADRVYIGPTAPAVVDQSQVVRAIQIKAPAWFAESHIELNPGLVAIVGEKGSGKTALAELLAYASYAWNNEESATSFIRKAESLLGDAEVIVTWGNGVPLSASVPDGPGSDVPLVRYLSQDFVEKLCSTDLTGQALVSEIESVVFSHLPEAERLDASSFDELRRLKTEHLTSKRNAMRAQLSKLNGEIVELQNVVEGRETKQKLLDRAIEGIAAIDQQLPALELNVNKEVAEKLAAENSLLRSKTTELAEINKTLSKVHTARSKLEELRASVETGFDELRLVLLEIGLTAEQIAAFRPVFTGGFENPLNERADELALKANELRGDPETIDPSGKTIADIKARVATLETELATDVQQRERLLALQAQRAKADGERVRLEREIKDIEGRTLASLVAKTEERWKNYLAYFDLIHQETEALRELYRPLSDILASDPENEKTGFEFSVRRHPNVIEWIDRGRSLVDLRKRVPYFDRAAVQEVEKTLSALWRDGDEEGIREYLESLLADFDDGNVGIDGLLVSQATRKQFFDWFFSPEHVTIAYSLKYSGTDLNALSPGARGIVLLMLYLKMDTHDRRPLVIDQPEGNLDSASIYKSLVPFVRKAKKERQIILVTHNPNLVVAADADQVIVATSHKGEHQSHPQLAYTCGSLENCGSDESIRETVCRILEGGREAFKTREGRYAISAEERSSSSG